MDRRQVCAQVLQSSLLPQAIGFIYPGIKDTHLPPQAIDFLPPQAIENKNAILPPQAIRPWNAAPATQKQQSPAAVKKITCGSKKWTFLLPQAIGASYRHKRSTSPSTSFRLPYLGPQTKRTCQYLVLTQGTASCKLVSSWKIQHVCCRPNMTQHCEDIWVHINLHGTSVLNQPNLSC